MNQILPVFKPVGLSTFDLIRVYKREHQPSYKVGHGGTLDPFASGLVLLLLGTATKEFDNLRTLPKTYQATLRLGITSDTLDPEGKIKLVKGPQPSLQMVKEVFETFPKEYEQQVPIYSAAKQGGTPLYKLARKGGAIKPKSKPVTIHDLKLLRYDYPLVHFEATVSSGTYIRQLGVDLATRLYNSGILTQLLRTQIGSYHLFDNASQSE